ncbi:uncharacterized protein FMAN_13057 [Fusarium mangiferae]|uniref:Rhodopsin domain-containing protein n=1 Tax=Fusarium mangiferae TaxID=192010 RepID=A0A1L7U317_FUSMA|nr:uncharacterized protein FMAN_13057 [Fusarium mangiferae]CVL05114.1 uncharacterized protein FMAN_13057 [Fusarium mangiferae]
MALSATIEKDIAIACICSTLILSRCGYRIYHWCKGHAGSHRIWHADDIYMAIALLPLISRTVCITLSFLLNPSSSREPVTEDEAAAQHLTVQELEHDRIVGLQLLVGTRLSYTLILWILKAALLSFYSRFVRVTSWGKATVKVLWCLLFVSCLVVIVSILAECRPMSLMWRLTSKETQPVCQKGMVYFWALAVGNISTDIALLILPFPTLAVARLNTRTKIQLGVLFSIGLLVIAITIVRIPLILNDAMSQKARSTWATIEILCSCIVANTPFFYGLLRELGQHKGTQPSATDPSRSEGPFYLQSKGADHRSYELQAANSDGNNNSQELIIMP